MIVVLNKIDSIPADKRDKTIEKVIWYNIATNQKNYHAIVKRGRSLFSFWYYDIIFGRLSIISSKIKEFCQCVYTYANTTERKMNKH